MSRCDLEIVFDRPDRSYRAGDEVSGTVHVQVNQDVPSDGVVLEHFWQTHGRGNTATGPKRTTLLYQGNLRAGEVLEYPFRFTAPDGPPTYHGRYLNVDHYAYVRVDIPWAIDPKLKEEYILLPGDRAYGNLPSPRPGGQISARSCLNFGAPGAVFMMIAAVLLIPLFFPCSLVLAVAGMVVLFLSVRKVLAEKKIGKVSLSFGPLTVPPGGALPVRLSFTPRKSTQLNGIVAKLVGKERCVSGSGTNKTTHTHKLYEQTFSLAPQSAVTAGQPIQVEGRVPIPETDAFSFSARDNSLAWEMEVRIDIPLWPDWLEKRIVTVRPPVGAEYAEATVLEEPSAGPVFPGLPIPGAGQAGAGAPPPEDLVGRTGTFSSEETHSLGAPEGADFDRPVEEREPAAAAECPEPEPPVDEQPAVARPGVTDPDLIGIIERIRSANRYSRQREQIIEERAEEAFESSIEIAKIERTYSYTQDPRFRKGRTVTGVLAGTDCEVSAQLVEARNDEIDALEPGARLQASCKLLKWNTIYDRLEMREA